MGYADALPNEDFLTSSHFQPSNHKRFAELLCDRISEHLFPEKPDTP